MNSTQRKWSWVTVMILLASTAVCQADPCGMVPPITIGPTVPLVRIGDQHTYVFYKDGIETIVLRPGFSGKVDEFGMLIPFPSAPAIRKVSDDIFPHIAAAIDPPEVIVQPIMRYRMLAANAAPMSKATDALEFSAVRVISQEAVGMYEVAVLEAGSSKALQRWMDDHNYKYPDGMDAACDDYVRAGWCFAAVKTRVGQKQAADPRPGQKNVDVSLPDGANFEGHVQAMGFRFRVEKMVVPMRLSTFNEGDLHNIVYILADQPSRIANLPSDLVVRQLPGEQLFKNVTDPLPLRVFGQKITAQLIKQYQAQRDPGPKNGAAKELFASDLLAVSNGALALAHEEQEKALLSISESLGLRGKEIDSVHAETLENERTATIDAAIEGVKKMTLTVVDGEFPRDVLARENLTFAEFAMDASKNSSSIYDAKLKAAPQKKRGILHLGRNAPVPSRLKSAGFTVGGVLVSLGLLGLVVSPRRKAVVPALLLGLSAWSSTAEAEVIHQEKFSELANERLIELFDDRANASFAASELVKRGGEVVGLLLDTSQDDSKLARRGWAISCLGMIGGRDVEVALAKIYQNDREDKLVRTWAAAARIAATDSAELLIEQAHLVKDFPALGRPLAKKLVARLQQGQTVTAAQLIGMTLKVPVLQTALAEPILATGSEDLVNVLTTATDQAVRRQAAAYLGTLASQSSGVPDAVVSAYAFNKDARQVPWSDGPLFIPRLSWPQDKARALVGHLVRWHVWCDAKGLSAERQQIHNNLRSLYLAGAAGYQSPGFQEASTAEWLKIWSAVVGKDEIKQLLAEQDVSPRKYGF